MFPNERLNTLVGRSPIASGITRERMIVDRGLSFVVMEVDVDQ
jgi:hypothetical protein